MGLCPQVEREIALHSRLRHRNIVAFHGHFADRDHVYMLLEYCSRQVLCTSHVHCAHLYPPLCLVGTYLFLPVPTPGPSVLILGSPDSPRVTCVHLCPFILWSPGLSHTHLWLHLCTPMSLLLSAMPRF